jgi:hypothetical protein
MSKIQEHYAFANGALDAYNTGYENNQYTDDALKLAYKQGYDYGIALYCQDNGHEGYKHPAFEPDAPEDKTAYYIKHEGE